MWKSEASEQLKTRDSAPLSNTVNSLVQQPTEQLGITPAISLNGPRPKHLQQTEELRETLKTHQVFETKADSNHRTEILAKLNSLLKQWVIDISLARSMPEETARELGGKIYPFGSYRLGVHHNDSDIDALCVVPHNIERTDYFSSFFEILKKQPAVTECRAIKEAFVPVIKMKFEGIEVDLLFARLSLKSIPDDLDFRDAEILKDVDQQSVRSLNGCRVTEEIISLVPNMEEFRLTLRAIKLWAKKHGIYSNSLGYFGGVSWAMLVARTCQLYPNAAASTLVHKFFSIFSRWNWPVPVLLKQPDKVDLGFPVWNPFMNVSDGHHLMPIITPAYPQQNSTFNVSESTKTIIMRELSRGKSVMDEIMLGKASWDRLFEAPNFFKRYYHFIAVLVNSQSADDHVEWCGLVESKTRFLVAKLERIQHISLIHANPKCFDHKKHNENNGDSSAAGASSDLGGSAFCSMWFVGLEFEPTEINFEESLQHFTDHVLQHGVKVKMYKEGMTIEARHVTRQQLSLYLHADVLKHERKSVDRQNISSHAIKGNRKRPSKAIKRKAGKRSRPSESANHFQQFDEFSNKNGNTYINTDASQTATAVTRASPTSTLPFSHLQEMLSQNAENSNETCGQSISSSWDTSSIPPSPLSEPNNAASFLERLFNAYRLKSNDFYQQPHHDGSSFQSF